MGMENERFDTETMNDDMAVYAETKKSNVFEAMKGDAVSFGALRRWFRYHRVSGSSFSTGKWWAYWKWYRTQTVESVMSKQDLSGNNYWNNIDFGGHSMESLCVYPFYENLKRGVGIGTDFRCILEKFGGKSNSLFGECAM